MSARAFAAKLEKGTKIALRDAEGFMPAVLTVEDIWQSDKTREAEKVYNTTSDAHPGVPTNAECSSASIFRAYMVDN